MHLNFYSVNTFNIHRISTSLIKYIKIGMKILHSNECLEMYINVLIMIMKTKIKLSFKMYYVVMAD
jgi:hypothetical protein